MKLMKIGNFQRFGKQSFPKLSKNAKGLEMSEKQIFSEHTPKSPILDEPEVFQKKLWFKSKSFGWGWTPCSKEGWLVTIGFILGALYIAIKYAKTNPSLFTAYLVSLIVILIFITYKTGEKPHWSWGNK